MNKILLSVCVLGAGLLSALCQVRDTSTAPEIVERELDRRVWKRAIREMLPDGKVVARESGYVELATGLHFIRDGQLVDSEERFEVFNDGLVARNGQHQVIISPNADAGAPILVDLLAPDSQRFRSHILGLAFMDIATGNSALIAEPQQCVAELVAPNIVLFRNAFTGPARCDIRYTYTRAAFEQDVIIREQLPSPLEYGLNPATTRLEIWTEFIEGPTPVKRQRLLKPEQAAIPLVDSGMSDELLVFGRVTIGPGVSFMLDDPTEDSTSAVGKNWIQAEGRTFLIEKVDLTDIAASLQRLPQAAVKPPNGNAMQAGIRKPSRAAVLAAIPRKQRQQAKLGRPAIQTASLSKEPGFVVDYQQTLSGNTNSFTFKADTTYFISGPVILSATNYIEGSSVIKMAHGGAVNRLSITGPLICKTGTYKPAIFTSRNDDTIGEIISGSTGHPTNFYGIYLDFSGNSNPIDLHDVRIRHAYYGLKTDSSSQLTVRHAQCSSNYTAIAFGQSKFRNVLIHDGMYAVGGMGAHTFENVTFHRITSLRSSGYTTAMTNCVIIEVTNNVVLSGVNNYSNRVGTGVFQSVGSATHYLASGSTNRDAGTTSIDPDLLSDLRKLTTFPPIVLSNDFTSDTVLLPQAQRDTDLPDLGYHLPPLDYCWTALKVVNARLTLSNDVAIGVYGDGTSYGIGLDSGAQLYAVGLPHRMARLVPSNLVQERALGVWSAPTVAPLISVLTNGPTEPTVQLRFLEMVLPGGAGQHLYGWKALYNDPFGFRDCQLYGGEIQCSDVGIALTNCLVDRVRIGYEASGNDAARQFHDNLFRGGRIDLSLPNGGYTWFKNNFFDQTALAMGGTVTHSHNGYVTGADRLTPTNAADQVVTTVAYEGGPLGWHYYPTNGGAGTLTDLVNAGSTNAHLLGFSNYTSATNNTKELTSVVDIGFRYVAVSAAGTPVDEDSDGIHDYLEDSNGDGTVDSGETNWQNADSDGDGISDYLETILGRNPLVAGTTNDFDGTLNLQLFTPLR